VSLTISSPVSVAISIISTTSSFSKVTSRIRRSRLARSLGMDYVLHQAAIPSVPRSVKDPITSNRANIDASLNVLCAARDAGVKRLVYAGSSSAYGDTPTLPKREDMPPSPRSPYALQKLVAEQYCQMFTRLYGFETVTTRYFNVFGPRQDPGSPYSGVISLFSTALLEGRTRSSTAMGSRHAISRSSPTWSTASFARARRPTWPAR
jgi:Nucleoside-diphosphate-sugar epimerases